MKEKTLVVMAAGMGSRFGGMKQIEPVGPNGEFIIDYSIYSAIRYGFNKVVFVIKEENYEIFKETIGSRIEDKTKVEYAFQKLEDIPQGFAVPAGRADAAFSELPDAGFSPAVSAGPVVFRHPFARLFPDRSFLPERAGISPGNPDFHIIFRPD